jgi:hypothetical protein
MVAVSFDPLGTVAGVQFLESVQISLAGADFQVALPARAALFARLRVPASKRAGVTMFLNAK